MGVRVSRGVMADPTVREAVAADVPDIVRVAERGWNAAYDALLDAETIAAAMDEWYDPSTVRERVGREDGAYFVAELDGTVVGYASGAPSGRAGVVTLGAIYVDSDHWDAGIGGALLSRFEAWCRRHGHETLRFRVLAGNDRAAAFYRAHGYDPAGEESSELFGETVAERVFRGPVD
jgi:GNAT superfamily N-acetyltransferase